MIPYIHYIYHSSKGNAYRQLFSPSFHQEGVKLVQEQESLLIYENILIHLIKYIPGKKIVQACHSLHTHYPTVTHSQVHPSYHYYKAP
jgi:hypothetical protein